MKNYITSIQLLRSTIVTIKRQLYHHIINELASKNKKVTFFHFFLSGRYLICMVKMFLGGPNKPPLPLSPPVLSPPLKSATCFWPTASGENSTVSVPGISLEMVWWLQFLAPLQTSHHVRSPTS